MYVTVPVALFKLSRLCVHCIAENLLRFESFEGVPMDIRAAVYSHIVTYYKLHPRHLALLLSPADQKGLDVSMQHQLITQTLIQSCPNSSTTILLNKKTKKKQLTCHYAPQHNRYVTGECMPYIAACTTLSELDISNCQ